LYNLQIEAAAENWPAARNALAELGKLQLSPDIAASKDVLAAKIPK
jgi:hypothetical protein